MAEDCTEILDAAVKGYMVWSLETGTHILTSSQVRFDETSYSQLLGTTEWEFSLKTRVEKCKAAVSV